MTKELETDLDRSIQDAEGWEKYFLVKSIWWRDRHRKLKALRDNQPPGATDLSHK